MEGLIERRRVWGDVCTANVSRLSHMTRISERHFLWSLYQILNLNLHWNQT
jgi:hypothetical protein